MRERAVACCSCKSLFRPVSYNLRVRVKLLSRAGVELAEVGAVDAEDQSLVADGGCDDVTDVAAVELRARDGIEEVVEDVSRFLL